MKRTALLLVGLFCVQSAQAQSAADLESAIRAAKVLPESRSFSVAAGSDEIRVYTYADPASQDPDKDCKIDAVMLARAVITRFSEVNRVVVDFHTVPPTKNIREVTITKPEIVAFGSGKVDSSELLAAIRVENRLDQKVVEAEQKAAAEKDERKQRSREAQAEELKTARAAGDHPERKWVTYQTTGLAFQHPIVWRIDSEYDGEVLVKFKSPPTTNFDAGIEVKLYRNPQRLPVMEEAQHHIAGHQRYKSWRQTEASRIIKFGVGNAFTGITEHFCSVGRSNTLTFEKAVYFGWPGYVYRIKYKCAREDEQHVAAVFNQLLSTLRLEKAPR